jgi:hypothetical protein
MLASFALQESSCNPTAVGGAGEQGLMQLTSDKCGDSPGGNCQDVVSNKLAFPVHRLNPASSTSTSTLELSFSPNCYQTIAATFFSPLDVTMDGVKE